MRILDDVVPRCVDGGGRPRELSEPDRCLLYTALSRARRDLYLPPALRTLWLHAHPPRPVLRIIKGRELEARAGAENPDRALAAAAVAQAQAAAAGTQSAATDWRILDEQMGWCGCCGEDRRPVEAGELGAEIRIKFQLRVAANFDADVGVCELCAQFLHLQRPLALFKTRRMLRNPSDWGPHQRNEPLDQYGVAGWDLS